MPFPMVHLCIAKRIMERKRGLIQNPSQFYLGAISPDAVHFRPNYDSSAKYASHLCIGDYKWGEMNNNDEWACHALSFLKSREKPEDFDFLWGYATHILADIYNNIYVWTPFRLNHPEEIKKGHSSAYHSEANIVDLELYQKHSCRDEIFRVMESFAPVGLPGLVSREEVRAIQNNILHVQYNHKPSPNSSGNLFFTYDMALDFIKGAVDFIVEKTGN